MITKERLKEVVYYQPHSGKFYWRKQLSNKITVGCEAGILDKSNGYLKIGIDNKRYFLQKLAVLYITGEYPKSDVHHKDENKLNNSWNNLQILSRIDHSKFQNIRSTNTSGVTGVGWNKDRNKWVAKIKINYKGFTLGYYDNFNDAVLARYYKEKECGWLDFEHKTPASKYLIKKGLLDE